MLKEMVVCSKNAHEYKCEYCDIIGFFWKENKKSI